MRVELPKTLEGKEYEEAVSSFIRAQGYFVENRIVLDHNGREILEIDTVATPTSTEFLRRILIDAKSGKRTGFADIFKIYGWRKFLNIPTGCIVRKSIPDPKDVEALERYRPELDVCWQIFNLDRNTFRTDVEERFPSLIPKEPKLHVHLFLTGWWAAIAERIAYRSYRDFVKANENEPITQKLRTYERACTLSFFEKDPVSRVIELYSAFKDYPHVSGKCIEHLCNKKRVEQITVQNALFDSDEYLWAQYIMLLEHRVRILIIKYAVEIILGRHASPPAEVNLRNEHLLLTTPSNFRNGMKVLESNPDMVNIPYLLHIFLELFGGFYVQGNRNDTSAISAASGVPPERVVNDLEILNVFFPTTNGWFQSSKDIVRLKFVPLICRGAGAFCRDGQVCDEYSDLSEFGMGWLIQKYHNSYVNVLANDIAVPD